MSAQNATVKGRLLNAQNKPLPFTPVSLIYATDYAFISNILSSNSRIFSFTQLNTGNYFLKVQSILSAVLFYPFYIQNSEEIIELPALKMEENTN